MNPMSIMAQAEKLGIPQLQRSIQDGTVPAFIGIPLLQEKVKKAKQMQMGMAAQQPKRPSVAEQINQEADQTSMYDMMRQRAAMMQGQMAGTGGISDMLRKPEPEAMAKGGMIAFKDGELVKRFAGGEDVELDPDYSTLESNVLLSPLYFQNTPAYEELKRRQGLKGILQKAGSNIVEGVSGLGQNMADMVSAYPAEQSRRIRRDLDRIGWYGTENAPAAAQAIAPAAQQPITPAAAPQTLSNQITAQQLNQVARNAMAANNPQSNSLNAPAPTTGAPAPQVDRANQIMPPPAAPSGIADLVQNARYSADEMDPRKAIELRRSLLGEDQSQKDILDRIAKREDRLSKEEEKAPWMALMGAGLGMMAGTSPFALTNIGQGAQQGLESYAKAKDKLEDKRDRLSDMQDKLALQRRAEDVAIANSGIQSAEAKEAHNKTVGMQEAQLKQAADLKNAEIAATKAHYNAIETAYGLRGGVEQQTYNNLKQQMLADEKAYPNLRDANNKPDELKLREAASIAVGTNKQQGATPNIDQQIKIANGLLKSEDKTDQAMGAAMMRKLRPGATDVGGGVSGTSFDYNAFYRR